MPAVKNGKKSSKWASAKHSFGYQLLKGELKLADRNVLYQAILTMIGRRVTVTTRIGTKYEGILDVYDPFSGSISIQHARLLSSNANPDIKPGGPISQLNFLGKDIECWTATGIRKEHTRQAFQTDTSISKTDLSNQKERNLKKWEPQPDEMALEVSLDVAPGNWDQFSANEKLFGVKTDFEETLYTTQLDRSRPDFKKREAEAERLANEIEKTSTTNQRIAHGRGDHGEDEEAKYSSVIRLDTAKASEEKKNLPFYKIVQGKPSYSKVVDTKKPVVVDVAKDFKNFVHEEKKIQMQKELEALKSFKDGFKLKTPMPSDLREILHIDKKKPDRKPIVEAKQDTNVTQTTTENGKPSDSKKPSSISETVEPPQKDAKTEAKKSNNHAPTKEAAKSPRAPSQRDAVKEKVKSKEKLAQKVDESADKKKEKPENISKDEKQHNEVKQEKKPFSFNAAASEFTPSYTPTETKKGGKKGYSDEENQAYGYMPYYARPPMGRPFIPYSYSPYFPPGQPYPMYQPMVGRPYAEFVPAEMYMVPYYGGEYQEEVEEQVKPENETN